MPESDPAQPIVAGILRVVPVSRWSFARIAPHGELLALFSSRADAETTTLLASELKLQRSKSPKGPRIAAMLGSLEEFESGIALVFADAHTHFGILTLLRAKALGPFTSSEIRMLTFALDALTEHLSALRLQPAQIAAAAEDLGDPQTAEEAFYVLDGDLQIVLAWGAEDQRRIAVTGLHTRIAERLPAVLEDTVRELISAWGAGPERLPGVAHPVPFLVVRTQPMSGPLGLFTGVRIDRFERPNSLTGAAERFHISPREVQVLALLLDGKRLEQIARQLFITSSTVQDHIKSMLDKTNSRNRSELIARVLGWELAAGEV